MTGDWRLATTPWLLLQLSDSAFPAGGFAHSYGLEAAWQQGEVSAGDLSFFVRDAVMQAAHGSVPFVAAALERPGGLESIDERCDVFLRNPIANRASRVQGRAWLGTVERAFPAAPLLALCEAARLRAGARHFAPVFGATLGTLGVEREAAARLFLFGVARGTLSAAVRLGIAGTRDAQRLLAESARDLDRAVAASERVSIDGATQTAPLIDLWQAAHDRLYSRLFQS